MSGRQTIVAVEFVGIYAERVAGDSPCYRSVDWKEMPGGRLLLNRLSTHAKIILHTVLLSEDLPIDIDHQARAVEAWMGRVGLPWDVAWTFPGKPIADHYVNTLQQLEAVVTQLEGQIHDK